MEISKDIKTKVLAYYLGQPFKVILNDKSFQTTECNLGTIQLLNPEDVLVLKPLSAITDDEAANVFDLEYPDNSVLKSTKIDRVKLWITDYNLSFIAVQYLQSKGYDLPHYLLGNKTLFETGLAIYEK